ncbi:MAG TPA: hypothetical protein VLX92_29390 [Kofleriaceae bacterium]|nr:hypothetical protein [Kofleriaceae bacterium]
MRYIWIALLAACASSPPVPPAPPPTDAVWGEAIHPGDLVVLVPGTGSIEYLEQPIEALPGDDPVVDVRRSPMVAGDAVVFEQAIAAAHRAGIDPRALTFAIWGAGFTRLARFEYVSYEAIQLPVVVLGGTNSCASGDILHNLLNYSIDDADRDARDLYARTFAYLAAHPAPEVIVASHSWGGAVAEYLAGQLPSIEADLGPLGARMPLTVADGVPGFVLGYTFAGPGLRPFGDGQLYEIDRPDDPVHAMDPSGDPDGHQYTILFGDAFQGSYGVTTQQLSCAGVPGECP